MKIVVDIKVIPVSKDDHDRVTELVDELWTLEQVVFDEYSNDNDINFSVDEGQE